MSSGSIYEGDAGERIPRSVYGPTPAGRPNPGLPLRSIDPRKFVDDPHPS
jgi:hypothetical protein